MKRVYVYLASRSKQGIKLITVLKGSEVVQSKLTDLEQLQLPPIWQQKIRRIIYDNRMLYEPWIESANSYEELKARLKHRGYCNLPMGVTPLLHFAGGGEAPAANTSSCGVIRTMTRKKK